jgi:hypothetical protein
VAGAGRRRDHPPGPLDQQRHLVGDDAHVGIGLGQDGEVRGVANRHDHEQPAVHLHDRLDHHAALEHARAALS